MTYTVKIQNLKSVFIALHENRALYLFPLQCTFHALSVICKDPLTGSSCKSISMYFSMEEPSSSCKCCSPGHNQGAVPLNLALLPCLWLAKGAGMELLAASTESMGIAAFQYQTVPLMLVLGSLQTKYIPTTEVIIA